MKRLNYFFTLLFSLSLFGTSPLYVGPDAFYRDFREEAGHEAKSEEKGWLAGIQAGFDFYRPWTPYLGADFRFAQGKNRFDGTVQSQVLNKFYPFESHTGNTVLNLEGRLGYTLGSLKILASPFLGFGWHGWMREAEDRIVGYDEWYRWGYLSFGWQLRGEFLTHFGYGIKINAMRTALAEVQIRGVYSWPILLNLAPSWQYEAELPISFHYRSYGLFWVGYFRYLPIGKSNTQRTSRGEIFVPSSITYTWGNRLQLILNF